MILLTRLAAGTLTGGALLLLSVSARWAYADWLSTRATSEYRQRAVRLVPTNSNLWLRLAELNSIDGEDVRVLLRHALACSPEDSGIWIRLGLESEAYGDYFDAERCLLRAIELDHDFIPAWTLSNFYFRRGNTPQFFQAARHVLAFSQSDLSPLFRMAWDLTSDATKMLDAGMPDIARPLTAYLNWMVSSDLLEPALPVSWRLLDRFPKEGKFALLSYCDQLISTGRLQHAVDLWNAMSAQGVIHTGPVGYNRINNGTFHSAPINSGFDWRLVPRDGMEVGPEAPGLWIRFSGSQPDRFEIASQPVLLERGVSHRLQYKMQRSDWEPGSGMYWGIVDSRNEIVVSQTPDPSGDNLNAGSWTFTLLPQGSEVELLRLVLRYERLPTAPRVSGWIKIANISLDSQR